MFERRRARVLLAILALVSLALLTLSARGGGEGPLESVRDGIATVFGPVQDGVTSVLRPVGAVFSGVGDLFRLREQNTELQARVEELEQRHRSARDVMRENEELRALLDMRDTLSARDEEYRFQPAVVTGLAPSNFEWTITLNVGTDDGVAKDMPVIDGDGLVGRIIQVGSGWSRALLAIDPNFSVAVRLAGSGEHGYLSGGDTEPMRLTLIDVEAPVEQGDEVVTSTYRSGLFPDGLPIGVVESVGEATGALGRDIRVRPFVDFTRLETVLVILRQPPPAPVEFPSPGAEEAPDLEAPGPDATTPDEEATGDAGA